MLSWIRLLHLPANTRFYGAVKVLGPAGVHCNQGFNDRIFRGNLNRAGLGMKISAAAGSVTSLSGWRGLPAWSGVLLLQF